MTLAFVSLNAKYKVCMWKSHCSAAGENDRHRNILRTDSGLHRDCVIGQRKVVLVQSIKEA